MTLVGGLQPPLPPLPPQPRLMMLVAAAVELDDNEDDDDDIGAADSRDDDASDIMLPLQQLEASRVFRSLMRLQQLLRAAKHITQTVYPTAVRMLCACTVNVLVTLSFFSIVWFDFLENKWLLLTQF